jgi:hypothetical protein
MILGRKDKNFFQRRIDKYKQQQKRKKFRKALRGNRKAIGLVAGRLNNRARQTIGDSLDKATSKQRLLALEGAIQQSQRVETTKRIFIKPFQRRREGKTFNVQGFWKQVQGKLDLPNSKIRGSDFLDNLEISNASLTASANLTRVVKDRLGNRYVMKASSLFRVKEPLAQKLGLGYERNINMPITEALLSDMAKEVGVRTQETILIPKGIKHPLTNSSNVYSLHKFLPGQSLFSAVQKGQLNKKFNVSFKFNPKEDRRTGKYFAAGEKIRTALDNSDLSKILAYGLTTSNFDMHGDNIWYNKGRFTLIDQGESLNFANDFSGIKGAIDNELEAFTPRQRRNLNVFKNTLKTIVDKEPPERVSQKLDYYFEQALGSKTSPYERQQALLNLERKKVIYKYNYDQAKSMVDWIDERQSRNR